MTYWPQPAMPPSSPPPVPRRRWWRRIGQAVFIWMLETLIGLVPLIAHEASSALEPPNANLGPHSALPKTCVLTVIASALALLGLLRDWFRGEAVQVTSLTIMLAFANGAICLAGAFFYPYTVREGLPGSAINIPSYMLIAALTASLTLAGERGFNMRH